MRNSRVLVKFERFTVPPKTMNRSSNLEYFKSQNKSLEIGSKCFMFEIDTKRKIREVRLKVGGGRWKVNGPNKKHDLVEVGAASATNTRSPSVVGT